MTAPIRAPEGIGGNLLRSFGLTGQQLLDARAPLWDRLAVPEWRAVHDPGEGIAHPNGPQSGRAGTPFSTP